MNNAEIVKEETVPEDVWEQLCAAFGAKPEPRVRFDGEKYVEDYSGRRQFTLHMAFLGERLDFERDRDAFLEYMEATFHESVHRAISNMRKELRKIQEAKK